MKISLSTIEKDGDKKITFNLDNGDVMDDNKFYLFIDNETYTYNNKKISTSYPLRYAQLTEITDKNNKNLSLWTFNGESYGILNYDIPIEALYECTTKDVIGYTPTDENEDTTDENKKAYSTTGVFKHSDKLKNKRFYVVAVTSNNCRTISPLYDYRGEIKVKIFAALFETISEDTESGYSYDRNVKLGIQIIVPTNTSDESYSYYIDKYPSNIALSFEYSESLSINEEAETDENKRVYFDISNEMSNVLLQILSNDFHFQMYKKKFNITVTDVTNLPIEVVNKQRENVQKFYAVVWQLNEEDVELPNDLEIETISYLKVGETIPNIIKDNNLTIKDKEGYKYELVKLPSNTPFKDGDKMEAKSIIITISYKPI